jgi:hypothetical protein
MAAGEFKAALRIVWIAISTIVLGTLLAPWILTPEQIATATPKCEWKVRYGRECFLCGMTTAFIDIAHGRLREAERSNRGSIPLYSGFLINEALLGLLLKGRSSQSAAFSKQCSPS